MNISVSHNDRLLYKPQERFYINIPTYKRRFLSKYAKKKQKREARYMSQETRRRRREINDKITRYRRYIYIYTCREYDDSVLLLHEPRQVRRLCFFTCKQLWITKRRKEGEKKGREGGKEGGRAITKSSATMLLSAWEGRDGWVALLFQSVSLFWHQLVLRR